MWVSPHTITNIWGPINKALIGTFGVGLAIIDGPDGSSAKFTDAAKFAVMRGLSAAASILYSLAAKYTPKNPPNGPDVLCDFTVQTYGWVDANQDGALDVQP